MTTRRLLARDVMTPHPACVEPHTTLRQFARLLEDRQISGAPVIDADGRVAGVASKTDLLSRCTRGTLQIAPAFLFEALSEQSDDEQSASMSESEDLQVQDFMSDSPVTVAPDAPAHRIAERMSNDRIHRVVVVDDEDRPLGIITSLDLLGAFGRGNALKRRPVGAETS